MSYVPMKKTPAAPLPHRHNWQPLDGQVNRFWCSECGMTGYKTMGDHVTPLTKRSRKNAKTFLLELRKRLES